MTERDIAIKQIRVDTIGIISNQISDEENFQNQTLRPILKLQNDLFLAVFIQNAIKNKNVFFNLNTTKKLEYIDHSVLKDFKFRQLLIGLTIALFTQEEFNTYALNSSNLNKRLIGMLSERLKSNIQLLITIN